MTHSRTDVNLSTILFARVDTRDDKRGTSRKCISARAADGEDGVASKKQGCLCSRRGTIAVHIWTPFVTVEGAHSACRTAVSWRSLQCPTAAPWKMHRRSRQMHGMDGLGSQPHFLRGVKPSTESDRSSRPPSPSSTSSSASSLPSTSSSSECSRSSSAPLSTWNPPACTAHVRRVQRFVLPGSLRLTQEGAPGWSSRQA